MDNKTVGLQETKTNFPPLPGTDISPTTQIEEKTKKVRTKKLSVQNSESQKEQKIPQKQITIILKKQESEEKFEKETPNSSSPEKNEETPLEQKEIVTTEKKEISTPQTPEEKISDENVVERSVTDKKETSDPSSETIELNTEKKKQEMEINEKISDTEKVVKLEENLELISDNKSENLELLPLYKETSYNLDIVTRTFFGQQVEKLALEAARLKEKLMVLEHIQKNRKETNPEFLNQEYGKLNLKYEDLKKDQKENSVFEEEQNKLQLLHKGFEFPQEDINKKESLGIKFISKIGVDKEELEELVKLKKKQEEYSENQKAYALMKALDKVFWEASNLRLKESAQSLETLSSCLTSIEKKDVKEVEGKDSSIPLSLSQQLSALLENIISVREAARIETLVHTSLSPQQDSYINYCFNKNQKYYLNCNERYIELKKQAQEKILELSNKFNEHLDNKIKCEPHLLIKKLEENKQIRKELDQERSELVALMERIGLRMNHLWTAVNLQLTYDKKYMFTLSYLEPKPGQKLVLKEVINN